jgi:cell division transport system permease protein
MEEIAGVLKRSWQSHFWTNLATTGVLTLSFSLILGSLLFITNLSRLFTIWGDEIQITIYLKDDITAAQKTSLESLLKDRGGVENFSYMNKADAATSFEKSLSAYGPQFLKSLKSDGENPFPASYSLRVSREEKTPEKIEALAQQFVKVPGVEDVSYGQEWIKNYTMLMTVCRTAAGFFTFVLLLACLFTVSNSVQASLISRREEIEILELVGATSTTIRKPFLIEGAFQGGFAAVVSLLILGVIYYVAYQSIEKIVGSSSILPALQFLSVLGVAASVIAGLFFGALGSYICVVRLNTGWAATARVSQRENPA